MKRIIAFLICIVVLCISTFAKEYEIKHDRIKFELPDGYTVVTRDTDDNATEWDIIHEVTGAAKEEARDWIIENDVFLFAINEERTAQILFEREIGWSGSNNYYFASDKEMAAYIEMIKSVTQSIFNMGSAQKVIDGDIENTGQTRFIKYYYLDGKEQFLKCETIWYDRKYEFYLFPNDGKITEKMEHELDELIQSTVFKQPYYTVGTNSKSIFSEAVFKFPDAEYVDKNLSAQKVYRLHTIKIILGWLEFAGVICLIALVFWIFKIKKRREKARDAALMAQVKKHCIACGEPMAEDAEVCTECGTRQ